MCTVYKSFFWDLFCSCLSSSLVFLYHCYFDFSFFLFSCISVFSFLCFPHLLHLFLLPLFSFHKGGDLFMFLYCQDLIFPFVFFLLFFYLSFTTAIFTYILVIYFLSLFCSILFIKVGPIESTKNLNEVI